MNSQALVTTLTEATMTWEPVNRSVILEDIKFCKRMKIFEDENELNFARLLKSRRLIMKRQESFFIGLNIEHRLIINFD